MDEQCKDQNDVIIKPPSLEFDGNVRYFSILS